MQIFYEINIDNGVDNKMIAEINNKMTIGEDELTGNFFGTLRYVRFEDVLLPVLLDTSHCENDFRDKSEFARI